MFEERYGPGTAAQYLRFAKGDHIALIAGPHPSKQAIEVFDEMYGPGMAYWYNMFASNNLAARTRAANEIRSMLMEGKNFSQEFETGATGNFFRGLERGPAEALANTANTITYLSNGLLGTSIGKVELPQELIQQNPWLFTGGKIAGQIATALGGASAALGATGGAVQGAGKLAPAIGRRFPLSDFAAAMAWAHGGKGLGKTVLEIA